MLESILKYIMAAIALAIVAFVLTFTMGGAGWLAVKCLQKIFE